MSSIDLTDVNGGYNLVKINQNFTEIERVINEELLHRVNEDSIPNSLETDIDANSRRVYNLPTPTTGGEPLRLKDLFGAPDELLGGPDVEHLIASLGQTVFTLSSSYVVGTKSLLVFKNGVLQRTPEEYTETSTTTITLIDPCVQDDVISVVPLAVSVGISSTPTTATSLGTGGDVYKQKVGDTLQFRSIVAGAGITVTENANDLTIAATGGSGTGESNTASNLGTGTGLFTSKSGVDLPFKSLAAGAGVSLADDGSTVTISAPGLGASYSGANLGVSGEGVYSATVGTEHQFKKLKAGTNVSLSSDASSITINASGSGSGLVEFSSYAALRTYTGAAVTVRISDPLLAGFFYADLSDTTSADNGGTIIVDSSARRWKREYKGAVNAAWFGAIGGGTDSTTAITNAFAASDAVHLEDWYYVSSGFSIPSGRSFTLTGIGQSKSGLWYTGTTGATVLTFEKAYSDKHVLTVRDVGFRSQVAGNTAVKIQAVLTAASVQVNGQMDAAFFDNVNISSESSTYWTTGIHIINSGGVHLNKVKIENRDSAQPIAGVRGIYIQNTDSRVAMIRTLTAYDTYIIRTNTAVETTTLSTTGNGIESLYFVSGEFIANTGFKSTGIISAVHLSGLHMDTINSAIDCSAAYTTVFRVSGCDFRKSNNGGSYTAGPQVAFDAGEGVTFTGSFLSGVEESVSSTTNVAIKFTNAITGSGLSRSSFSGNTFRAHYYVFGTTPIVNSITAAGNSYGSIVGAVNQNTDEDTSIAKQDSVVAYSFIAALNTTGDQLISHTPPNTLKYFTGAHLIVIPTIASSYNQQLTVSYDYDSSSNSNYVFRVKGNTAGAQNVRISYIAYGQSVAA